MLVMQARTRGIAAAMVLSLTSPLSAPNSPRVDPQFVIACPNTGELVIDKIKICYFTCPDNSQTSIRIGADGICPPFH